MKHWMFPVACLIALVLGTGQAQSDETIQRLTLPPVAVTADSAGNAAFSGPDLQYAGQAGEPAIPYKIVHLLLPSEADMTTLHVFCRDIQTERVPGKWHVKPLPPPTVWDGKKPVSEWPPDKRIVDGKDLDIYESDAKFPGSPIGRTSSGNIRHWKLIEVPVALFQYNPVSGMLDRLADIELVVSYARRSSIAPQSSRFFANDAESIKRVKALTVNFMDIAPRDGVYNLMRSALAASAPTYAIITTDEIAAQSSELVNFQFHKEQRGFNVHVVTEGEWGGGTGDTAAENIRSWLQANYQSLNIEYVLLIGNPHPSSGDVPMKMLWPRSNSTSYRESPSDYYYADLTGNWDADNDGLYGEWNDDFGPNGIDRYWEVRVGRIPYYGTIEDLDHILAKLIHYQQETRESAAWRKRILLPMEPSDAWTPGYHLGEAIKDAFVLPKCDWTYHRVYDDDYSLYPTPETTPCNMDNVTDAWNATPAGAVFWWTHGGTRGASDIMDLAHAATLDDDYPAFTFQSSCYNSYPEDSSNLSYTLLKNGGISTIGSTRVSWYFRGQTDFSNSTSNSGMTYEYAKRLIRDEMDGSSALNDLKETLTVNSSTWMNYTVFNLYGDPETALVISEDIIIDNDDPGSSASGNWAPCDGVDAYGGDSLCSLEPDASYTYQAQLEGQQAIYLWWSEDSDRCSEVYVHIYNGETLLDSIQIDQSQNAGRWNLLDAFQFSDMARVVITSSGDCTTCADAVRFSLRPVIFVDGGQSVSGDGSSWSEAFQTIQEAVGAACPNTEIWVKKGHYSSPMRIEIRKEVHLYGGFQGNETTRRARNWKQNATVIDGQDRTACIYINSDATINGFTITNGYAPVTYGPPPDGAGILIRGASTTIENVTFSSNKASGSGGAVYNDLESNSTFLNCVFIDNTAKSKGGAIFNTATSKATITNCMFSGNSAGAVVNWKNESVHRLLNCIFTNNSNGAIDNIESNPTIINCTIVDNPDFGIANTDAQPIVTNSIVWGNEVQILDDGDSSTTISYSNIDQAGYTGTDGNIRQDPQFILLTDDDFRLGALSPCIDAGIIQAPAGLESDFSGGPRFIDGDGDGAAIVDMGALEAFITATGHSIGIQTSLGTRITQCGPVDPATIDAMPNRPDNLIYGLIQMTAKVHQPGAQGVYRIALHEPAPDGFRWFMHTPKLGWIDFSRDTISGNLGDGAQLSDDRSQVTLYITDNGPYDDDPDDGVVRDPTGLGTAGVPDVSTDPATIDFGVIDTADTALQSIVITNLGTGDLDIGTVAITGGDASAFSITGDDCSGNRLAYSEVGTVSIAFLPLSPGDKQATLSIPSSDPADALVEVPLSGTGVDPPTLTGIAISGPSQLDENTGAQFTCTADYSDGSARDVTNNAEWGDDSPYAAVDSLGYVTADSVTGHQSCHLSAVYDGLTASHTLEITDTDASPSGTGGSGGGGGSGCFMDTFRRQ